MSNTRKASGVPDTSTEPDVSDADREEAVAELADAIDITADAALFEADDKDAEIERLRRAVTEMQAAAPVVVLDPADPRDNTIAILRQELAELRSTPEGEAAELRRSIAALTATVERMASGQGLVPLAVPGAPEPYLYGLTLECGDSDKAQHPHSTHHYCPAHGTVPVRGHYRLSDEMRELANR